LIGRGRSPIACVIVWGSAETLEGLAMDEISQREKREVLRDCYLSRAQADADLEAQGRFKKQSPTMIVGTPQYPKQPANSPWHSDPVPPEPPLDFDLNFVGELGGASAPVVVTSTVEPNATGDGGPALPLKGRDRLALPSAVSARSSFRRL